MGTQVKIGGERLRSGKGMTVNMHSYERSNHNIGNVVRTSMSTGTLVPLWKTFGLPGDTIDLNTTAMIRTLPTTNALFGRFKGQLDWFVCPIRLYVGGLHNNTLNIGQEMDKVVLPKIRLAAAPGTKLVSTDANFDVDTQQIAPDSLNAYLGIKGVGYNPSTTTPINREMCGIFHLAYYDICKNFYINKQEGNAWMIGRVGDSVQRVPLYPTNQTGSGIIPNPYTALVQTSANPFLNFEYPGTEGSIKQINIYVGITTASAFQDVVTIAPSETEAGKLTGFWEMPDGTIVGFTALNKAVNGRVQIFAQTESTSNISIKIFESSAEVTGQFGSKKLDLIGFPIKNLDKCRTQILNASEIGEYVTITQSKNTGRLSVNYLPYSMNAEYDEVTNELFSKSSQAGLLVKTHLSDLFNNWVKTDWIEKVNQRSSIQVTNNTFTMDSLLVAKRVFNYLNRVMLSGGSMQDWQEATWGVDAQSFCESPIFCGGMSFDIIFDEVVSTSGTETEALGTLAGRGNIDNVKGGRVNIKIKEPSIIMCIASITPHVDYSQGNDWETFQVNTLEDLHKPEFDGIGFQDLPTELLAWWDVQLNPDGNIRRFSAGKQPAWIQYMTNVNKVYGDFARKNNAEGMVITRNYQPNSEYKTAVSSIADLTTYIQPSNYNYLFADSSLENEPFWMQVKFDMGARRKMSAAVMPNL